MIEAILAAHAATEAHAFENRGQSVGASEVGQCLRKIYYSKHGAPSSDGIAWGPAARGTLIEDHLLVPAFRAQFGDRFLFAGDEQQTFRREELSATPDGLLVDLQPDEIAALGLPANTTTIVTEFKTVDPRTRLEQAKPEHAFQVQAQLGLLRECTNHRPTHALIIYCNASDLSVREFVVEFDPSVYAAAKQRARKIMSASEAAELAPEGYIAGGRECETCPYATPCGLARTTVPDNDDTALDPVTIAAVAALGKEIIRLDAIADAAATEVREQKEAMRNRLRDLGVRRVKGDGISIHWSQVKGRMTVDVEAMRTAGIDVTKFEKQGAPSDRLTVKTTSA
ncbi:MAG: hypothetical protein AUI16_23790 [Alphaproteobacteria bacterium 13_2_20CM_2_64_7]|nr:MAG: hypothetical protein AUI16_23790 [Alphaproteobacteria bacterium 13_2_20CM_2_64_7]